VAMVGEMANSYHRRLSIPLQCNVRFLPSDRDGLTPSGDGGEDVPMQWILPMIPPTMKAGACCLNRAVCLAGVAMVGEMVKTYGRRLDPPYHVR